MLAAALQNRSRLLLGNIAMISNWGWSMQHGAMCHHVLLGAAMQERARQLWCHAAHEPYGDQPALLEWVRCRGLQRVLRD